MKEFSIVDIWDRITKFLLKFNAYVPVRKIVQKLMDKKLVQKLKDNEFDTTLNEKEWCSHKFYQLILDDKVEIKRNKEEIVKTFKSHWNNLYAFIDVWTIFCMVLSICVSLIVFFYGNRMNKPVLYGIIVAVMWRNFEIILRQFRTVLFDTVGKHAVYLKNERRSIILLFHNLLEMIMGFSTVFIIAVVLNNRLLILKDTFSWFDFLRYSTLNLLTYGDGLTSISDYIPQNSLLMNLTFCEIILGLIVMIVSFSRLLSILPNVKIQDEISKGKDNE